MNFAQNLKRLRDSRCITQLELAEYLHVSRPTIAGYETKNKQPDYNKLLHLSEFFQVSVDYLLTGEENSPFPNTIIEPLTLPSDVSSERLAKMILKEFDRLDDTGKRELISIAKIFNSRKTIKTK